MRSSHGSLAIFSLVEGKGGSYDSAYPDSPTSPAQRHAKPFPTFTAMRSQHGSVPQGRTVNGAAPSYRDALTAYLARLEASDVEGLAALFAPAATVLSPILGRQAPRPFFAKVCAAS